VKIVNPEVLEKINSMRPLREWLAVDETFDIYLSNRLWFWRNEGEGVRKADLFPLWHDGEPTMHNKYFTDWVKKNYPEYLL